MEINIENRGEAVVLRCVGSLDADTVALFKKRANELFDGGASKLIMDATGISFIDSMGLGAMIALLRRTRKKNGDLKIFGLNKSVREIFDITRLHKLFDVCKDIDEACGKF